MSMTPKEKAKELVDKFVPIVEYFDRGSEEPVSYHHIAVKDAKRCAIICVEETIKNIPSVDYYEPDREYWKEVLTHLKTPPQ